MTSASATRSRRSRGGSGGPWSIFATTYALEGVHAARFELTPAGEHSRVQIGESVEIELEPIRNPVTGAEVHPGVVLPEGLVFRRGSFATTKTFRVQGAVEYGHPGQHASFSPFAYGGP